jgi:hypothetical protein
LGRSSMRPGVVFVINSSSERTNVAGVMVAILSSYPHCAGVQDSDIL